MKSRIVLFITIVLTFLLQSTLLKAISLGSINPNILLILCVSMGLMRGKKCGMWTGFFSGLLIDLFYGSLFGFYALIYMYIGYFCGYTYRIYFDDDIKVPVCMVAIADLIYGFAVYILQFLLRGRTGISTYFVRIIIPEMFYTVLAALVIYHLYHFINYHFMTAGRKERESTWVLKLRE